MLPSDGTGNVDKPFYDNQREWKRINSFISTGGAIQAPFTFYYIRSNDWSESHNYQFWNKNFSTDSDPGINNVSTLKTIYDPSISGFVLPKTAAFTYLTSSGNNTTNSVQFNVSGSFNKGWNFYTNGWKTGSTIFFHTFGLRDTSNARSTGTGALTYIFDDGDYWSSGAYSASGGRNFTFYTGGVFPQGWDNRSSGYAVRSVKEDL